MNKPIDADEPSLILGDWKPASEVAQNALNRVLSRLPNPVHIDADGRPDMSLPFTEDADVLERDKLEELE